nr:unnamed protein product [Spirometra erinaceieuropaei]
MQMYHTTPQTMEKEYDLLPSLDISTFDSESLMSDLDVPYAFDEDYRSSPHIFNGSPLQSDSWHDSSNQSVTDLSETQKNDDSKSENPTLSETFLTSVKSASSTPPPLPPRPCTLEPQVHKRPLPTLNLIESKAMGDLRRDDRTLILPASDDNSVNRFIDLAPEYRALRSHL